MDMYEIRVKQNGSNDRDTMEIIDVKRIRDINRGGEEIVESGYQQSG
jgi:hypothetical protein